MTTNVHVSLDERETTFSVVIGLCFRVDQEVHDDVHADSDETNCATSWVHGEGREVGKVVESQSNDASRC